MALTYLNLSRLGLLRFRQNDCDHPVFHLGADFALVDTIGNLKAACVVTYIVLSVDRMHSLVLRVIDAAFDGDNVIFNARLDGVAVDTRHFQCNRQRVRSFKDIGDRHESPARRCAFRLLVNFPLLLDLQFLFVGHSKSSLAYLDRTWLIRLCPWYEQGKNAVAILGLDAIRLDSNWDRQSPVKHASNSFATMDARLLAIDDCLFAPDANGVLFCLDLQIVLVDTGQLHDGDKVVVFLEYVDRRKAAYRGGAAAHPVACDEIGRASCRER